MELKWDRIAFAQLNFLKDFHSNFDIHECIISLTDSNSSSLFNSTIEIIIILHGFKKVIKPIYSSGPDVTPDIVIFDCHFVLPTPQKQEYKIS